MDGNGRPCNKPRSIKWVFNKSLSNKNQVLKLYDYVKNNIHLDIMKKVVDVYIGPSKTMSEYLKEIFDNKKVKNIPYIIAKKIEFKSKKRIKKRLLFIGRLEREKGLSYLIKALKYLKSDISLDIIGKGPEEEKIKRVIKKLNIRNNIAFVGEISNKNIQKYYHSSDVLIMPSIWMEQFGIVGLESIASGTPAIASNIGGINDWLKENKNGFLVPPRNPKKIAEAVKKIIYNKNLIKKYSKNSRKIFKENFTKEKHYKRLIKAYKDEYK